MSMPTVTVNTHNGPPITVTAMALDLAIARYLPASPARLQAIVCERSKLPEWMLDEGADVSSLLVILAALDYGQVAPATAA